MQSKLTMQGYTRNRIILALVIIVLIMGAFVGFASFNSSRIIEENSEYLKSSTSQTVMRVNELLSNAELSVKSAAQIYEETLTKPEIDLDILLNLVTTTSFDHLRFIDPQGTVYISRTQSADASDREYYIQGMMGKSGISVINHSAFEDERVLVFYTPIRYENEILGVLTGIYGEATVTELLTTFFFDEQASTYLCNSDGLVIGRATTNENAETLVNIYDFFAEARDFDTFTYERLVSAFEAHSYISFDFAGKYGSGMANAMLLPDYSWMLVCTFPASITDRLINNANQAGIILMVAVAGALCIFIAFIWIQFLRQRRLMQAENKKAGTIIDASANLFRNFVLIDFDANSYEYLKPDKGFHDLPLAGQLDTYRYYWENRYSGDDDKCIIAQLLDFDDVSHKLDKDTEYLHYEYSIHEDDGIHWLQTSVLPIVRDSKGVLKSVLLATQDVTDVKEREMAQRTFLEEAYRLAEQASQAKSDFLNNMSHDIRTPMNSIMGLTAIAQMHLEDKERLEDCLTKISAASSHLLGHINEVLDMAKIESGTFSLSEVQFQLSALVERVLAIMAPQMTEKDLNLTFNIDQIAHDFVVGDSQRLQQIFVNIIGNAIKFTEPGGSIGIHVEEKPARLSDCGRYVFTFSDTGCGMSEDFMKHLFEPFTRANDSRTTKIEGTGLGMSIVNSVVSLMNGTINVDSTLGEGTTFVVEVHLRLDSEMQGVSDASSTAMNSTQANASQVSVDDELEMLKRCRLSGKRILLTEDIDLAASIATEIISITGAEIVRAENGRVALDLLLNQAPGYFDLVFMDIQMPILNGYEAARAIRNAANLGRPDLGFIPIIALTADAFNDDIHHSKSAGMNGHISKPMEIGVLVNVFNEWLR